MKKIKNDVKNRMEIIDQELVELRKDRESLLKALKENETKIIFANGKKTELAVFYNTLSEDESE